MRGRETETHDARSACDVGTVGDGASVYFPSQLILFLSVAAVGQLVTSTSGHAGRINQVNINQKKKQRAASCLVSLQKIIL